MNFQLKASPIAVAIAFLAIIAVPTIAAAQQGSGNKTRAKALKVGDKAPDFQVTGIDGKPIRLSEKIGEDGKNIVLVFSRASW